MDGHVLGRPLSLPPHLSSPRLLLAGFAPVKRRWLCATLLQTLWKCLHGEERCFLRCSPHPRAEVLRHTLHGAGEGGKNLLQRDSEKNILCVSGCGFSKENVSARSFHTQRDQRALSDQS